MKSMFETSRLGMVIMLLSTCSIAFAGAGDKKRLLILTDIGGDPPLCSYRRIIVKQ